MSKSSKCPSTKNSVLRICSKLMATTSFWWSTFLKNSQRVSNLTDPSSLMYSTLYFLTNWLKSFTLHQHTETPTQLRVNWLKAFQYLKIGLRSSKPYHLNQVSTKFSNNICVEEKGRTLFLLKTKARAC